MGALLRSYAQYPNMPELHGNSLADKAVVGTEWWQVRAGLSAGVLTEDDIAATGYPLQTLERTVRTR